MSHTVETRRPFEFMDSKSIGRETPLSDHVYKTLFMDNDDDEGSIIVSKSILRMRLQREEVLWCNIHF